MDKNKKKQIAFALQLLPGEMENIDAAKDSIPLASKNAMGRAALHIGIQSLLSMDPGDAAQVIHDFNQLPAASKFTK